MENTYRSVTLMYLRALAFAILRLFNENSKRFFAFTERTLKYWNMSYKIVVWRRRKYHKIAYYECYKKGFDNSSILYSCQISFITHFEHSSCFISLSNSRWLDDLELKMIQVSMYSLMLDTVDTVYSWYP